MEKTIAEKKVSFSLAGCGFLGIYHIGAAACLSEHVPHVLEEARFCGASAGALIACSLICNVPMDHCVDFTLRLARSSGQYPLGGWEPTIDIEAILRSSIDQVMPVDAHKRCTDRLFVSVTSLNGLRNQIISKFRTRKELLDTLMCSAYVPGFSSYTIPRMGEEYFLDGGLSDNLPILDSNTITICPWAGEHSICPQDPEGQSFPLTMMNMSICPSTHNLARFKDAFFCPKPETLKNYCWQGYDDALRFLHENHLIHCKVHRVLAVLTNLEHRISVKCDDCEHHRDHARNCELPSNIKAYWEDMDWWKKVIPHYTGLVLQPVKLICKIWLMPVTMLRHYVTQLFLVAYFQVDKFRHGGLSAEVLRLVKKLGNPRQFLWELLLITMSKLALQVMEYWTRVFSEVCALGQTWKATQRIIRKEICQLCGVGYDLPPGPLLKVKDDQKQADDVTTTTLEEGAEKATAGQEEQGVSEVVQEEASVSVEATAEGEEATGAGLPEAAETMAVWVDIHANSVDMVLPLPEQADQPATEVQAPKTVHVEGVGEIQEVVIDPVMVVPAAKADQPEAAQKAAEVSQQKTERIHQYVHKLEHLKSIMTLHYVDENSQRHTESLFVEEMSPLDASMESASSVCPQRPQSGREGPLDKVSSRAGAEVDSIPEEAEEQVDKEVKQLLETKLFTGQRKFEKSYEASHQLRLKKKKRKEVRKDTGHFSLQLISLGADNPPSPVLSRSASLRSVMEDDGELVRSVSDACTLASSIRKLREMKKVGVECSMCDSCSSLNEAPLAASHSSLTESSAPCTFHHHRSPSPGVPSQQFRLKASPAPLRKCLSDTSEVSANLRLLKMDRLPPQDNRTPARESTPVQGDHFHGVGKRPIPRVATAPVLASPLKESQFSFDSSGATVGPLSSMSQHSLLPIIPDDTACSHPQPVVPCVVSQREVEGEGGTEVSQQAAVTAHTAFGQSTQHGKVKAPGGGGRLQRSWAIHRSGGQRSQLLSNLRKLKTQSSSADSTPISTHPTLVSTRAASSSALATPPTTDPAHNTTSPSATTTSTPATAISISTPAITISTPATPSSIHTAPSTADTSSNTISIHTASSIADTSSSTISTSAAPITSLPATTISSPTAPSSSR